MKAVIGWAPTAILLHNKETLRFTNIQYKIAQGPPQHVAAVLFCHWKRKSTVCQIFIGLLRQFIHTRSAVRLQWNNTTGM